MPENTPIVIPAPVVKTVTQIQPVSFEIPAEKVPATIAAIFAALASNGCQIPEIPAELALAGINANVMPNGKARVMAQFAPAA